MWNPRHFLKIPIGLAMSNFKNVPKMRVRRGIRPDRPPILGAFMVNVTLSN